MKMDLERAKELNTSSLWPSVVGELDLKISYEIQKLKLCKPEELGIIQAKIACYESLTRLPADVIDREE